MVSSLKEKMSHPMAMAVTAFFIWGIMPLYYQEFEALGSYEVLAHRQVWSFLFMLAMILATGRVKETLTTIKSFQMFFYLVLTSIFVTIGWGLFIIAIEINELMQSSLAYYINPLVNVVFGVVFLKEKLTKADKISLSFATIGCMIMIYAYGYIPWIAITIGVAFGIYVTIRKKFNMDPVISLFYETMFFLPISLGYLIYLHMNGEGAFGGSSVYITSILPFLGLVSCVPMVLYMAAANRVTLSSLSIIAFIEPTCHLIISVFISHEPFSTDHGIAFIFIWIALIIYTYDGIRQKRKKLRENIDTEIEFT